MTNLTDLDVDSITIANTTQAMTGNGAINIKEGVVTLTKSGILAATLAAPVAGVDDGKRLTIISKGTAGSAHTVTSVAGALVATFSGVIGDTLDLVAHNGVWQIAGCHQVTFA
jgi:hypothetical protein